MSKLLGKMIDVYHYFQHTPLNPRLVTHEKASRLKTPP
jgi:hypothetical protein